MVNSTARPWKTLLPLIAVLSLLAAWSCYWFIALTVVKVAVANERLRLAEQGFALACSDETWGGYPFRFEFACSHPRATVEGDEKMSSAELSAVALAYNPWHVILLLDGPTNLRRADGRTTKLTHSRIAGSIKLEDNRIASASFEIPGASAAGLFTVRGILFHWRQQAKRPLDIALSFDNLALRTTSDEDLAIGHGELIGNIAADRRLNVENLELSSGTVRYWGAGHVEVDEAGRISGQLSTETNNLNGLLDIIEPVLLMSDQQEANFRLALGLLGQNAKADVLARDGKLFIGPFKVADLVPLY